MLELIRRIGTEFGISVIVTSHLLGELERVCDGIVVIDGGRLMRHSTTASVTAETPIVTVEVDGNLDGLLRWLSDAGVSARSDGKLLHVDVGDPAAYDLVRDAVAELGLGLVRVERQRHRMTEMFTDTPGEQGGVHV
jgi:ABC-2 type transport system ATP-binding protein